MTLLLVQLVHLMVAVALEPGQLHQAVLILVVLVQLV
jgi:hypothetical protein